MTQRTVLVINSGSSSIKYQLVDPDSGASLASGLVERIGEETGAITHKHGEERTEITEPVPDHGFGLSEVLRLFEEQGPSLADAHIVAVGHRVVQGGRYFSGPALIDDDVVARIEQLVPLGPLHNPAHLKGIEVGRRLLSDVPHVAVFDTAFFQDLPEEAARYALDRLLTDPDRRNEWDDMRQALRGFGLHVTDSGIRTGRSPLDVITAASRAKDAAAIDILRHELEALGERLRAVVVTDAAERSAPHRALDVLVGVDGAGSTDAAGGAVRCFNAILADTALRGLHPILLTSSHLRLAHGDDELLEHLRACTGLELPARDDGWSLSATGGGVGSADLVLAVSGLVASGAVRLVVGTRGLLGEGWDCPAVNTLVDLTTVTTSTAVQQLRGRTLRLDPAWPGKVAHNWSVACLVPAGSGLRSTTDLDRLRRKADRLWAVVLPDPDASGDSGPGPGAPVIETGLAGVLLPAQRRALDCVEAGATREDIAALNTATVTTLGDRQAEGSRWSVGASGGASPMTANASSTSSTLHGAGRALEVVRIRARGGLLRHGTPTAFWTGAARAVLAAMGEHDDAVGSEASGLSGLLVLTDNERAGIGGARIADTVVLGLDGVSGALSTRFADALAELLAPPRRRPRFVLEAAPLTLARPGRPDLGPVRRMLGRVASLGVWGAGRSLHLPVPTSLAASRVAMTAFAQAWSRYVGPCRVRLVRDADDAAALLASRGGGGRRRVTVRRARRWIEASEPRTTR
mgnify:CR=1 FL=1